MTSRNDLHTRLAGTIIRNRLCRPGDTLIIGLSGGADSTALLDLLATLPGFPLRLVAAHLNHCLRGTESDGDEQFCRELAARYRIPFESRRTDVEAAASAGSQNLEDAGRQARILFFDELTAAWDAAAVVLAHHADDQAETVLMRLLRGAGSCGLAGMSPRNGRGYIRPLLDITRKELEEYLVQRRLEWREDASNLDTGFLRNRIRHELLPTLRRYNPAVREALNSTAGILADEDALLDSMADETARQLCTFAPQTVTLQIPLLCSQHIALQRRVVRKMLSHAAGCMERFGLRHVEDILRLSSSARSNLRIDLPRGVSAVKAYDTLVVTARGAAPPDHGELTISGPGEYRLPDGSRLRLEPFDPHADRSSSAAVLFDCDRAPFPWHVRTVLPGDRIQPLGMNGRKKVKDLFIDEKVPLGLRARIPLVFSGNELIWAVGLRTSHPARTDSSSTRIVSALVQPAVPSPNPFY